MYAALLHVGCRGRFQTQPMTNTETGRRQTDLTPRVQHKKKENPHVVKVEKTEIIYFVTSATKPWNSAKILNSSATVRRRPSHDLSSTAVEILEFYSRRKTERCEVKTRLTLKINNWHYRISILHTKWKFYNHRVGFPAAAEVSSLRL